MGQRRRGGWNTWSISPTRNPIQMLFKRSETRKKSHRRRRRILRWRQQNQSIVCRKKRKEKQNRETPHEHNSHLKSHRLCKPCAPHTPGLQMTRQKHKYFENRFILVRMHAGQCFENKYNVYRWHCHCWPMLWIDSVHRIWKIKTKMKNWKKKKKTCVKRNAVTRAWYTRLKGIAWANVNGTVTSPLPNASLFLKKNYFGF